MQELPQLPESAQLEQPPADEGYSGFRRLQTRAGHHSSCTTRLRSGTARSCWHRERGKVRGGSPRWKQVLRWHPLPKLKVGKSSGIRADERKAIGRAASMQGKAQRSQSPGYVNGTDGVFGTAQ